MSFTERLAELLEGATAGPWMGTPGPPAVIQYPEGAKVRGKSFVPAAVYAFREWDGGQVDALILPHSEIDSALICHLVNRAPALLAVVEAAEAQRDHALSWATNPGDDADYAEHEDVMAGLMGEVSRAADALSNLDKEDSRG